MSSHGQAGQSGNAQSSGNAGTQPETHTGDSTARPVRECEECFHKMPERCKRIRCKNCGAFVCWWCYQTLHGGRTFDIPRACLP
jgi:hypothetical protein